MFHVLLKSLTSFLYTCYERFSWNRWKLVLLWDFSASLLVWYVQFWLDRKYGSTFGWIRFKITWLITLVAVDDIDIPRRLLGKLKSPFLGTGTISLSPSGVGFSLLIKMLLAKLIITMSISHYFNTSGLMPSRSGTLFCLICFLTCSYSELVKWPVLNFKSLSSRMVVTVFFSCEIFEELPSNSWK